MNKATKYEGLYRVGGRLRAFSNALCKIEQRLNCLSDDIDKGNTAKLEKKQRDQENLVKSIEVIWSNILLGTT